MRTAASRPARRPLVALAPAAVALIVLSSCGSDSDAAPAGSTIDLTSSSTNFVTVPPTPSTEAPVETEPGTIAGTQEYVVQAGDYPLGVANTFGVSLDDLVAVNEWAGPEEFPFPGTIILIPPGGRAPGASDADAEDAVEGTGEDTTSEPPADLLPEAGDNCGRGEHVIVAGDLPIRVAEQYDVTLESLAAENAGNPAYQTFIPGQIIYIPAKSDC